MGGAHEAMAKAGVAAGRRGLHPSSKGARVTYTGPQAPRDRRAFRGDEGAVGRLLDDPGDVEGEALEWASRIPFTNGEVVEVRQVFEASDFPADVLPPEAAAREEALRAELQRKAKR